MNKRSLKREEKQTILLFLSLPLLLLLIFGLLPIGTLIYNSFSDWDGLSVEKNFVGFKNYITIWQDPVYFQAFKTNLFYLGSGLLQIMIALALAILLSTKTYGKNIFKAVIVFPIMISGVWPLL